MARFDLSQVRSEYQESFIRELAGTFENSIKTVSALCGQENTLAFFRSTTHFSNECGFKLRGEIVKYSFISLHLGLFFQTDPMYEDIRGSMLWKHAGAHPNVGLNRIFRSTDLMIAEGLCAPHDGVAPGFGASCRAAAQEHGNASVSTVFDICSEANPKRIKAIGTERILSALNAVSRDPRLQEQSNRFVRDWLICTYHLGFGFDSNPLFSWIPEKLARDGLVEVGSMLDG